MESAKNSKGNIVFYEDAIKGEQYRCGECNKPVIFRVCSNAVNHFAHKKGITSVECENKMCKWHIMLQYKVHEWQREKTVKDPETGEICRADALLGNTAIEFQHSKFSTKTLLKRIKHYIKLGYRIIFVFDLQDLVAKGKIQLLENGYFIWTSPYKNITNIDDIRENFDSIAIYFDLGDGAFHRVVEHAYNKGTGKPMFNKFRIANTAIKYTDIEFFDESDFFTESLEDYPIVTPIEIWVKEYKRKQRGCKNMENQDNSSSNKTLSTIEEWIRSIYVEKDQNAIFYQHTEGEPRPRNFTLDVRTEIKMNNKEINLSILTLNTSKPWLKGILKGLSLYDLMEMHWFWKIKGKGKIHDYFALILDMSTDYNSGKLIVSESGSDIIVRIDPIHINLDLSDGIANLFGITSKIEKVRNTMNIGIWLKVFVAINGRLYKAKYFGDGLLKLHCLGSYLDFNAIKIDCSSEEERKNLIIKVTNLLISNKSDFDEKLSTLQPNLS